eukprot:m.62062 g.62062  ORF g.62062 m.62062 type:complete len:89 (+) comp23076_c0_seq1:521-787(+)
MDMFNDKESLAPEPLINTTLGRSCNPLIGNTAIHTNAAHDANHKNVDIVKLKFDFVRNHPLFLHVCKFTATSDTQLEYCCNCHHMSVV